MNRIIDYQDGSSITREACAWIVQLDSDDPPSPQDLSALREWMARGPAHRAEIARVAELWGRLGLLTELAAVPAEADSDSGRRHAPWIRIGFAAVAALALVSLGVLWLGLVGPDDSGRVDYVTGIGEQRRIVLPDGSSLLLNTDSLAVVDFSGQERRVRLDRGEAHFDVHKDPARPFIVQAGEGQVRALGTAFSVRMWGKVAEVNVTEGRVEVTASTLGEVVANDAQAQSPRTVAVLEAGYTARLDKQVEAIAAVSDEDMARKLTWQQGMLVFSGDRLDSVVSEVNRYTTQPIEFGDPALGELRIGGQFRIGETEALFDALAEGFGIDVHQEGGRTVLSRAASPANQ